MAYRDFVSSAGRITFREVLALCEFSYEPLRAGQVLDARGARLVVDNVFINEGFAAYSIRKDGGWQALVFRGTDDARDWILNNIANFFGNLRPPQYISGEDIASRYGQGKILVGHSLGGGIATFASAYHGIPAATIFPAPVVPESLPQKGNRAKVRNYVCHGEALTELAGAGRTAFGLHGAALDYASSAAIRMSGNPWSEEGRKKLAGGYKHGRLGEDVFIESTAGDPINKHLLPNVKV